MLKDLSAILFVDNIDLLHLDLSKEKTLLEVFGATKASIIEWGKLLMEPGGALKPEKRFSYFISFDWDGSGKWSYARHKNDEGAQLMVPLSDGSCVLMKNVAVDELKETLGIYT